MKMNILRIPAVAAAALLGAAVAFAPSAGAACPNCGTVTDVKTVKKEGEGSGVGAVAGGVLGGVLGHQIGSGRGNTAATIVGAGAGALVGNEVEKNKGSTTAWDVRVRLDDGSTRTVRSTTQPSWRVGDKVRVENGKLVSG